MFHYGVAIIRKTKLFGELVMFSHTLFSLPFAVISMVWAAEGIPSLRIWGLALLALVTARNGANAFNRLVDARFDKLNPRTNHRHLPQGLMNSNEVIVFILVNFALLVFAAGVLNTLCLILSPVAIVIVCGYSYTKRFTWLSHLYLGFVIASAPIGAWFAVTGEFAVTPFVLGSIVMLWIAGFDIIYATQDIEFDRGAGLFSIPSRFGLRNALRIAQGLHLVMLLLLVSLYFVRGMGPLYIVGLVLALLLLLIEHRIVMPSSRSRMMLASYKLNQVISMMLLFFIMADFFIGSS